MDVIVTMASLSVIIGVIIEIKKESLFIKHSQIIQMLNAITIVLVYNFWIDNTSTPCKIVFGVATSIFVINYLIKIMKKLLAICPLYKNK